MQWIDINDLKSKNAFINMLQGIRGRGKTFGVKEMCVGDFLKNGDQFIYIRRYESELKTIDRFWDDMYDSKKIDEEDCKRLKVKGRTFYYDNEIIGYNLALSKANNYKSTAFPDVTNIIFDEFVIEDSVHHYIKNEVELFLSFLDTIIRTRDNVRVWMLSNNATIVNPYTVYFDIVKHIDQNEKKNWFLSKDKLILFYADKNESFAETRRKTKLGRLISTTHYGQYALDNIAYKDDDSFVKKKPKCSYLMGIKVANKIYGVWLDRSLGDVYISNDYIRELEVYTIMYDDHTPNDLLLEHKKYGSLRSIVSCYRNNRLYFESLQIKKGFYEALIYLK